MDKTQTVNTAYDDSIYIQIYKLKRNTLNLVFLHAQTAPQKKRQKHSHFTNNIISLLAYYSKSPICSLIVFL